MSEGSALSRVARASLAELRHDFESLAPKFLALRHLYIEYSEVSELPLPALVGDRTVPPHGGGPTGSDQAVFLHGKWVSLRILGGRLSRVWESWYEGDGKSVFHALADRAGAQLEPLRIGVPPPGEVAAVLTRDPKLCTNPVVLPGRIHRWVKALHWLAWAGEVMPVRGYGMWKNMNVPFDEWDETRFGPRPATFCSIIDNVFLRSVAALDWMIERIERTERGETDETPKSEPSMKASPRNRRGRSVDTKIQEDRRLAEAWQTGQYTSIEELSRRFEKDPKDVRKALDRHRHRGGKSPRGNRRQDP